MHALDAADLRLVIDVVYEIGEARDRDELLRASLAGVVLAVPCLVATLNEVDPSADRVAFWMEPASFSLPPRASEILAELADEHPVIAHISRTGDGSAHTISDFWSTEQLHRSRLYRELYAPMGVEHQVSVTLPAPRPVVLGLAVSRGRGAGFSARDRAVLDALRPHLAQAWRRVRDQERLRALVAAAGDAAVRQGWGAVVLWDPPVELTPGALDAIERFFGRPHAGRAFSERVERWVIDQAAAGRRGGTETVRLGGRGLELRRPLHAQRDGQRVVLQYSPAETTHPAAIIVREERRDSARRNLESLGLTRREAEIVRLVLSGMTNAAIAGRLRVAPGTVKKHLENVYGKLSVRGRGPLTAFVLDVAGA